MADKISIIPTTPGNIDELEPDSETGIDRSNDVSGTRYQTDADNIPFGAADGVNGDGSIIK